jgi:hypothetical protein
LKQQVKDLEAEKAEGESRRPAVMGMSGGHSRRNKSNMGNTQQNRANEDLINLLEHKLEEFEKKLQRTQGEYELLQGEYMDLQQKMNLSREKYKRAALLMTEFLDDLLNQTPNILDSDKDMHVNLEKIKETPIENLDKEDKVALVLVLLKQLQPYLSSQNLSTTNPPGMSKGSMNVNSKHPFSHNEYISAQADNILQQNKNPNEVDALNNILNNINVSTKNNFGQQNTYDGKLPPIN